jgi:hypothetical protein
VTSFNSLTLYQLEVTVKVTRIGAKIRFCPKNTFLPKSDILPRLGQKRIFWAKTDFLGKKRIFWQKRAAVLA